MTDPYRSKAQRIAIAAAAADEAREWTARRDAAIREAVDAGATLRELADALELSRAGIHAITKRHTPAPAPPADIDLTEDPDQ